MTSDNTDRFIWKDGDVEITRAHSEEDGQAIHTHDDMALDHDGRTHSHALGQPVTHTKAVDYARVFARALEDLETDEPG